MNFLVCIALFLAAVQAHITGPVAPVAATYQYSADVPYAAAPYTTAYTNSYFRVAPVPSVYSAVPAYTSYSAFPLRYTEAAVAPAVYNAPAVYSTLLKK